MKLFALYGALLVLACGVLVYTGDPLPLQLAPGVPFYKTTGWLCYGCGSTGLSMPFCTGTGRIP